LFYAMSAISEAIARGSDNRPRSGPGSRPWKDVRAAWASTRIRCRVTRHCAVCEDKMKTPRSRPCWGESSSAQCRRRRCFDGGEGRPRASSYARAHIRQEGRRRQEHAGSRAHFPGRSSVGWSSRRPAAKPPQESVPAIRWTAMDDRHDEGRFLFQGRDRERVEEKTGLEIVWLLRQVRPIEVAQGQWISLQAEIGRAENRVRPAPGRSKLAGTRIRCRVSSTFPEMRRRP